jgi:hypothetical protein
MDFSHIFSSPARDVAITGTVSRDFRPLVFSSNNTPGSTGSWAKAVSNIKSYYSTTKIANFYFYFIAMG